MHTLKITDGTTTIDLLDKATKAAWYALEEGGYAPAVATKKRGGGYHDVTDTMRILIGGTGPINNQLRTLRKLLEQAERWGQGEAVNPVYIEIRLAATQVTQSAVIWAPPDGAMMQLPDKHLDIAAMDVSYPVTLRFSRRGAWLDYAAAGGGHSVTAAFASTPPVPGSQAYAFTTPTPPLEAGSLGYDNPHDLTFSLTSGDAAPLYSDFQFEALALIASPGDRTRIRMSTWVVSTLHTGFSKVADSGAAGGSQTLRSNTAGSVVYCPPDITNLKDVTIYAVAKASDSRAYRLQAGFSNSADSLVPTAYNSGVTIRGTIPHIVNVGTLSSLEAMERIFLRLQSVTGTGSGHLFIDQVFLLANTPHGQAVYIDNRNGEGFWQTMDIRIRGGEHLQNRQLVPTVTFVGLYRPISAATWQAITLPLTAHGGITINSSATSNTGRVAFCLVPKDGRWFMPVTGNVTVARSRADLIPR